MCVGNHSWEQGYTWVQFTEITQLLVEFFVVKDHVRDGFLLLLDVDQALTTYKVLSMQRAWHSACTWQLIEDVPSNLVQINDDVC